MANYDKLYLEAAFAKLEAIKRESYADLKIAPSLKYLDLGCGSGIDSSKLASEYENSYFIGIDNDPIFIKQARESFGALKNLEFLESSIYDIKLDDGIASGVRLDRVTQHLTSLDSMFKEVKRVIKRNGRVVILDVDWSSVNIYGPDRYVSDLIVSQLANNMVSNGMAAKELPSLMVNYCEKVSFSINQVYLNSLHELKFFLRVDEILIELVQNNLISNQTLSKYQEDLNQFDQMGVLKVSMNFITTYGDFK